MHNHVRSLEEFTLITVMGNNEFRRQRESLSQWLVLHSNTKFFAAIALASVLRFQGIMRVISWTQYWKFIKEHSLVSTTMKLIAEDIFPTI